jgi:FKBP-type peptidyl-prolyl cis-trans isomerase (trigger factor)
MKTEIKKLGSEKLELSIEVSGDIVKNKFNEVFEKIGKEAKVPGFRPGHAPRDILEKHFSSEAHKRVTEELIPDVYGKAVKQEKLDIIDLGHISEVNLDSQKLSFKATVELRPEIKLKDYKGLKVNYKKVEVSPDEIKRGIDSLKESRKVDSADDNFAKCLGYPDLIELEKTIERQIFIQKDNLQRQRIENEIVETITKELDFKIPQSLIDRQLQELVRQAKLDLALKGATREDIDRGEKTLSDQLAPEAKRQVKTYLVFAEIAKRENLPLDDHMSHHVIELLLREADWKESS